MDNKQPIIKMVRVDREILSVKEYIILRESRPESIKRTKIIAPRIGANDFGKIEVTYNLPRYIAEGCR